MTNPALPLRGEDFLFALLLRIVLEHCSTTTEGELKSFRVEAHADAMEALAEAGYIEIVEQGSSGIRATTLPLGETLIARLLAEKNAGPRP